MTRGLWLRATTWLVALAMFTGVIPGGWGAVCATAAEPRFVAPVKGPIVRRFEPPLGPYAAGHRGIDFGVPVGTQVVASGDGVVAFAGPVAGDGLFVTIAHNEVVQTTYSFMSQISVARGQKVRRGEPIGLSGSGHPEGRGPVLHFGLKVGGQYMNPEILLLGELDDISDLISLAPIADEYDRFILERSAPPPSARSGSSKLAEPDKPWHIKLGGMIAGFGRSLKDATLGATNWTKDKALKVGKFVGGVVSGVGHGIGWAFNGAKKVVKATGKAIGGFFGAAKDFLVGTGRGLRLVASRAGDFVGKAAHGVGDFLGSAARSIGDFVGSAARSVGDFLGSAARTVGDFLEWGAHQAAGYVNWVTRTARELIAVSGHAAREVLALAARATGNAARWVVDQVIWLGDQLNRATRGVVEGTKWLASEIAGALKRVVASLWKSINESFFVGMVKGAVEQIRCSREGGAPPPDLPTSEELKKGAPPPPPPNDNIVIAIGGIGSHTAGKNGTVVPGASMYQMDFRTLGFSEDQVYFYSYRGLEDRGGSGPYGFHAPYTKEDSYQSLVDSAKFLRKQIEAIHREHPDKEIDLVAHSQGGLVAQYFISLLYDVDNDDGLSVDHFVSIAAPHQGADAAQLHGLLSDDPRGELTLERLDAIAASLGFPPPSAPSAREMAEDSPFIAEVNEHWDPGEVRTTTIADTFDVVVTPQHTRLEGADNYTADMPGDAWKRPIFHHGDVVSARSTKEILYNALADTPSECTALRNAFADYGAGRLISAIEDGAALLVEIASETQP